ncbi:Cytochrome P450 716B2 [Linum perenne]
MSFNPTRFRDQNIPPYVYVPFGGGPRVCAGSQLAKLNILVLVHYVVTSYDWSLVLPNEGITMDPLPFPSHGMPIRITPKSSISIY